MLAPEGLTNKIYFQLSVLRNEFLTLQVSYDDSKSFSLPIVNSGKNSKLDPLQPSFL